MIFLESIELKTLSRNIFNFLIFYTTAETHSFQNKTFFIRFYNVFHFFKKRFQTFKNVFVQKKINKND
jgi:hypothetical protein